MHLDRGTCSDCCRGKGEMEKMVQVFWFQYFGSVHGGRIRSSFSVSSVSTAARELCGDVRKPDISCK